MWSKVAKRAVKAARQNLNISFLNRSDYEDALQSAEEGILKGSLAIKKKAVKDPDRYIFISARNQAVTEIIRNIFGKNPFKVSSFDDLLLSYSDDPVQETRVCPYPEQALIEIFLDQKTKKGERGFLAAKRDTFIIRSLIAGANNKSIANDLNISEDDVRSHQARIRKILAQVVSSNSCTQRGLVDE